MQLKIHTENILPIIKKWLYSDKDIFVRELVSNSCDALSKCRILKEQGQLDVDPSSFRIDLEIDKEKKTLTISDNGIGMTAEEVEKYIAQIAFSGAEEFVHKYQNEKEPMIGHFGLGFYSAYMVSSLVTIDTLSYKEGANPAFWSCDGSINYTLETGKRTERGTTITLHITLESEEFLEETTVSSVLKRYCAFLPVPLFLNGVQINKKEPLFLKNSIDCTEQEYIEFYRELYPMQPDPIFWVHLNIDYPFHLKAILYFPKIHRQFDFSQNTIKLFCNRIFVSDNCKDLIPDYLMILQGAIDSPDIPLNVSRSTLQMDRTVRQLSSHIAKKISDRLSSLYSQDKEKFLSFWPSIELIVKLGILQDEKFYDRVKECLVFKTTKGEFMTPSDYLAAFGEKTEAKLFYVSEDQKDSPLLNLYSSQGIDVLIASSPVDTPLMNFLEDKLENAKFQRIDGALHHDLIETSSESEGQVADFIRSHLSQNCMVEAKSLKEKNTPALLIIDEEMRRFKESMSLSKQTLPKELEAKKTFIVNTNNKLIQAIAQLQDKELAKEMVQHLFDLSLLSQRQLDQEALSPFVARSAALLEKLLS
ncbi:MAG: chaperone protein htpG [Chlamydiota bacterium]